MWNPATCSCEYGKYEGSIIDNSAIIYDENIRNKNCSNKYYLRKFDIKLAFLLITIALLITISIYCYFMKYQVKQKPSLPCHYTIS